MTPLHTKKTITFIITLKKYTYKSENTFITPFHTKKNNRVKKAYNKNKKILDINDVDVNKILVSKKEKYGKYNSFKYFTGYYNNDVITPLYLELSQMNGYINKHKNKNKNKNKNTITMSLMVKDKQLFKNHNKIWKKN